MHSFYSASSLAEDHLAEIVASTSVFDDLLAEFLKSDSNALVLGRCGVVVGFLFVVNWVTLEVAEELWQVLTLAVSLGPPVFLRAVLWLCRVLCWRLVYGRLILVTFCLDDLLFYLWRLNFFVFDL